MKALPTGVVNYDPKCVDVTPENVLLSMTIHTVLHEALRESWRAIYHDPLRFRYAMECKINQIIQEGGLPLGPGWVRRPEWDDLAPEEIVGQLEDISEKEAVECCPVKLGIQKDPLGNKGHTDDCNDPSCQGECNGDGQGQPNYDPGATVLTAALLRMQEVAKDIGTECAGLNLALGEILNPQLPWQVELRQFFQETVGIHGRSYHRPSRRSDAVGVLLPGRSKGLDAVTIAIDVSGSVVCDPGLIEDFLSECNEILRLCGRPCRVILHESDIVDDFECDDLNTLIGKMRGSGGTDFRPVFERISEGKPPPLLVFLTDLYGPLPNMEPNYPILWVCGEQHDTPPWGRVLELPTQRRRGRNRNDW
jgi:predicted metal-dependent peptidase